MNLVYRRGPLLFPPNDGGASSFVVSSDFGNLDLFEFATDAGFAGGFCSIEIAATAEVFATDATGPACTLGGFGSGDTVELILKGKITGAGGEGGQGGSWGGGSTPGPGVDGQAGGTALHVPAISGVTFRLYRLSGSVIRGGGGGGGGGGSTYGEDPDEGGSGFVAPGGGGGGAQGRSSGVPGLSGTGLGVKSFPGSTGSVTTGGAGGFANVVNPETGDLYTGGIGGNGGAYGTAGTAGGVASPPGGAGGAGGAAGKSIDGLANVTVMASAGTIIGPTA